MGQGSSAGRRDGRRRASGGGGARERSASYRFRTFWDKYHSLEEVQEALRVAGLESSNLILAVDMTKSNTWTGKRSYGGKCLHALSATEPNPYEQAISIIGRTLAPFDEDDLIPVYGFGDTTTHDTDVFSFQPGDKPFHGFHAVLDRYRDLISSVKLAGPTSFAPIINQAASIAASTGQFHILVIIADGQVTRPSDTPDDEFSRHEKATMEAIVRASGTPLSIVLVGVGDGPWDMMQDFDDNLPSRQFDNFQFVCAADVMRPRASDPAGVAGERQREARFALSALMEVPEQYQAIQALHLLRKSRYPCKAPLDPPAITRQAVNRSFRHLEGAGGHAPAGAASGGGGAGAGGGHGVAAGPTWHCATCTFANSAVAPVCAACGAARPAAAASRAGGDPWHCGACTFLNDPRALACATCATARDAAPRHAAPASYVATPVAPSAPPAAAAPAPAPALAVTASADAERLAAELESMKDEVTCVVCMERRKNVVFGCGHQVCDVCAPTLQTCPMCRKPVTTRIKMF